MTKSHKEKGYLIRRAVAIGVPRFISIPIVLTVLLWVSSSGVEWAVDRLKQIRVDFVRKRAGQPPVSKWIGRSSQRDLIFSGVFGSLERWAFMSDSHFGKSLNLLSVYTTYYATSVTVKQATKFLSGVTAPAVTIPPELIEVLNLGLRLSGIRPRFTSLPKPKPLLSYLPSPSKRAPVPHGSVPEIEGVVDSVRYLGVSPSNLAHYHKFLNLYSSVLKGLEPELDVVQGPYTGYGIKSMSEPDFDQTEFLVGRIGLIQEAGFKLRAVANPGRVFQVVLEPLGRFLFDILSNLPWDCTFQQGRADNAITEALSSHRTVYSVDLSGATDYFPLELQRAALVELLPGATDFVDLFCEISKGKWIIPNKEIPLSVLDEFTAGKTSLCWSKGQPLGLFPSFASFALTHGLLLLGLLGRTWNGEFFVLGDDVVILDDALYVSYREALDVLGCPVSESKTLTSNQVAEFRSILFLESGKFPQFKWRRPSDDSFMDIIHNNPSLIPLLLPRQRKVIEKVASLPTELGGLGLNPLGLSLETRIYPFLPYFLRELPPRERLMGYTEHIRRLLYSSSLSYTAQTPGLSSRTDLVLTLDQRVMKLVSKYFPGFLQPLREILGKNLDLVVHGDVDLPGLSFKPSRVTTLYRWETILRDLSLLP